MKFTEFIKNAGVLTIGNGISQAIMFVGVIILARHYSPAEFGYLALVSGIAVILGSIAAGRYEMTILYPKTTKYFYLAKDIAFLLSIFFHVLLLFLSMIAYWILNDVLEVHIIVLTIIISFSNSLIQTTSFIQNRELRYLKTAFVAIIKSTLTITVSWLMVFSDYKEYGLIIGLAFSSLIIVLFLLLTEFGLITFKRIRRLRILQIYVWLRKYIGFIKYSFPAVFVNQLSVHAPVFLLTLLYDKAAAGIYSMLIRLLIAPLGLVSGSINRIYLRIVAVNISNNRPLTNITSKISLFCLFMGLGYAGALILFSEYLHFESLLGEKWVIIDNLIINFVPMLVAGFVSRSISGFDVLGKNATGLVYQLVVLGSLVGVIIVMSKASFNISHAIISIAYTLFITNIIQYMLMKASVAKVDQTMNNAC